jgi:tyrosyl-tRNA synthetase
VARELQRKAGIAPQVILTMPLLEGTDGVEKMSKSYDNYIGLTDPAEQMYGKALSIPDELITKYMTLTTDLDASEIESAKQAMAAGSNPRDYKRKLARELVKVYYTETAANAAEEAFDKVFIQKDVPDEMPEMELAVIDAPNLLNVLNDSGLFGSRGEIRRLIKQNAVKVDGTVITDEFMGFETPGEFVIKAGKRKFLKLILR